VVNNSIYTVFSSGGGGASYCTLNDCSLTGNSVVAFNASAPGGAAVGCTLNHCILSGNSVVCEGPYAYYAQGGAAVGSTLNNCILSSNSAVASSLYGRAFGGGASGCTLNNCKLTGNWTSGVGFGDEGGGADDCTLINCTLSGNASQDGGGAASSTLRNCALDLNLASSYGGGAYSCTLANCTLTGNSAQLSGGGALHSTLNNCVAYFNTALIGANYDTSSTLNYCCTTPLPSDGQRNVSSNPELASAFHLSAFSPCIGKGDPAAASGLDIDGEPWTSPPSIGCDEYHAGALTGPLSVAISSSFTNVATGFPARLTAWIEGHADLCVWEFGDGAVETNQPYTAHAWSAPGDYVLSLWAFSDSYPGGISTSVSVHVVNEVHYVAAGNANPRAPYTSWAAAAANIQDAIAVAVTPGAQVLVTNGTYAPITTAYNLPVRVSGVSGAQFTTIDGGQSNRCASLGQDTSLTGFTMTNGYSQYGGGGAYGGTLNNCILTGNSVPTTYQPGYQANGGGALFSTLNRCALAGNSAYWGGGASFCALDGCLLAGNSALYGGGAYSGDLNGCALSGNTAGSGGAALFGTLNNCTLAGNTATNWGGGVQQCTVHNCIAYFNTAPTDSNYDGSSVLNYCCTTPQPTNGVGNLTNAPLFVDQFGGNLRLQSNSPCINAGNNSYLTNSNFTNWFDLDGNPRIAGGTVDIGAYEYQSPTSLLSYAWLQQYGLPTDGSADFTDPDGDGMNNWQEWRCGTDPTNALSALRLLLPIVAGTNVMVTWQSAAGVNYFLERSTNLTAPPAFVTLAMGIQGQAGTTTFVDSNARGAGPFFYRVGVGN
jgi:hypothetical protein